MSKNKLYLSDHDWQIFVSIIQDKPYEIYAYGSRVKGEYSQFSDVDLLVYEILEQELYNLKNQFSESNLAVKIDIKTRADLSDSFYALIVDDLIKVEV